MEYYLTYKKKTKFSDIPAPSTSEVEIEGAQGPEQPIPEGFFDDPILDAKVSIYFIKILLLF